MSDTSQLLFYLRLQAFIESMATDESSELSSSEAVEDFSDLWLTKPFKESNFWFMKADDPLEASEMAPNGETGLTTLGSSIGGDEQAIININNLVVKVIDHFVII